MLLKQSLVRLLATHYSRQHRFVRSVLPALLVALTPALMARAAWAQTPLALESLTISPTSVIGGNAATGTVRMNRAVSSTSEFGQNVTLTSSDPKVASVPRFAEVPPGKISASFTIQTAKVPTSQTVTISATFGRVTRQAKLTVQPAQIPVPQLVIKPNRLDFNAAPVGGSGGRQRFTLNNTGNGTLQLGSFTMSGPHPNDFILRNGQSIPRAIPPNGSAAVEFEFIPRGPGARTATLAVTSNAAGSPHAVTMSGAGLGPVASLNPPQLSFFDVPVGSRSATRFVSVANAGNAPLVIQNVFIDGNQRGDFGVVSGGSPITVGPGQQRVIGVAFLPSALGPRAARLVIQDNAPGSPRFVALSGNGVPLPAPQVTLFPTTLLFGNQTVGGRSAQQFVTLRNVGTAPLAIRSVLLTGAQPGDFLIIAGGEPITLPVGGQRAIAVVFAPTAAGPRAATLAITTNAPNSPHVVALSGTGIPAPVPPGRFEPSLPVGNSIAAGGRLGIFGVDPRAQDQDVSAVRRVTDDGAVYMLDYAGTALLRIPRGPQTASVAGTASVESARVQQAGGGVPEILVDTTRLDPVDSVGLARLLRVETARNGVSVLLALRADHTRGIYRVEGTTLMRLGLLTGPTGPAEMDISDTGIISYVAPGLDGLMALTQAVGTARFEMVRQGQTVGNSGQITTFTDLSSNAAGDVVARAELSSGEQAVLRIRQQRGAEVVALTGLAGSRVARDLLESRANQRPGVLASLHRPRIGPDGTVVFLGVGQGFVNFFADGGERIVQPILIGAIWSVEPDSFDYKVAGNGAVALRAAPAGAGTSGLFLGLPSGGLLEILRPGGRIQPIGRPVFGPEQDDSRFFFLGRVIDRQRDRQGRLPVGLFRVLQANGRVTLEEVASPGDPVPGKRGAVLISVTQRPVVTASEVIFGILFGSNRRGAVPTASLFRAPVGGTLAQGQLVADEGAQVPNAGRLAMLRDISYQPDGSLVLSGLLPGAGPLVASVQGTGARSQSVSTGAIIASGTARIQAITVTPLLTIGQPMAPPDRQLLAILAPLLPLGTDRQLLVARYSQADGLNGEGLFTVDRNRLVQAVAATGDAPRDMATAPFIGFADTEQTTLTPPAVSKDGNLVFKARLEWGAAESQGVFQWSGLSAAAVAVSEPNPDDLRVLPTDVGPYSLERWVAGTAGAAYLMARPAGGKTRLYMRSVGTATSPIQWLVVPDVTPVVGPTPVTLTQVSDFVLDGTSKVYVAGATALAQGLFRLDGQGPTAQLTAIVLQGQPVPKPLDGTNVQGFVFGSSFTLLPDSVRGSLLFRAQVTKTGTTARQGLFRLGTLGVETIMIENLEVGSAREITYGTLATTPARQTVNGISAYATFYNGKWSIYRWKAGVTSLVAQEGQALPGGTSGAKIVSLDAGPVLDLPPGSGPIITLNDTGDVAFLATDGLKWGIYLFTDRP